MCVYSTGRGEMGKTIIEQITIEQYLDAYKEEHILSKARAEKSFKAECGKKPKFHKGKHIKDWWTCGNCGATTRDSVVDNYCSNCGYRILWENPRCLTGK